MVEEENKRETNGIRRVEDMPVFRCFYDLAVELADCTSGYPSDFTWLRIQSLRSSESVIANMSEGFYSQYSTEYLQCLFRCRREARETMTHLNYARDVAIISSTSVKALLERYEDALAELSRLIASIERKAQVYGKAKSGAVREEQAQYEVACLTINH